MGFDPCERGHAEAMNRRIALDRAGIRGGDYWAFMTLPATERTAVENRLAAERKTARLRPELRRAFEASWERNEEAYRYLD